MIKILFSPFKLACLISLISLSGYSQNFNYVWHHGGNPTSSGNAVDVVANPDNTLLVLYSAGKGDQSLERPCLRLQVSIDETLVENGLGTGPAHDHRLGLATDLVHRLVHEVIDHDHNLFLDRGFVVIDERTQ